LDAHVLIETTKMSLFRRIVDCFSQADFSLLKLASILVNIERLNKTLRGIKREYPQDVSAFRTRSLLITNAIIQSRVRRQTKRVLRVSLALIGRKLVSENLSRAFGTDATKDLHHILRRTREPLLL
jgi:hypothetical protein